jgi:hypothetical protein
MHSSAASASNFEIFPALSLQQLDAAMQHH